MQDVHVLLRPILALSPVSLTPSDIAHLPPMFNDLGYTPISSLNRNLSQAWYQHIAASITLTRSDSSEVDVKLWDNHITLIFPQATSKHFKILRGFLMRYLIKLYRLYF